tara:strand:+ start:331 stop:579 length:249 start_codon:yes stop_codon:yes gene_type:complete
MDEEEELDKKIKFFRKQKARSKKMSLEPTIPGDTLLTPYQYDGLIRELLNKKNKKKKKNKGFQGMKGGGKVYTNNTRRANYK